MFIAAEDNEYEQAIFCVPLLWLDTLSILFDHEVIGFIQYL
jgi:hypothetical protein